MFPTFEKDSILYFRYDLNENLPLQSITLAIKFSYKKFPAIFSKDYYCCSALSIGL